MSSFTIEGISLFLQETNRANLLLLIVGMLLFWMVLSIILIQFIPKKYHINRKEIFLFMVVLNTGLLFMGVLLTLVIMLFGLAWATSRVNRPTYEILNLDDFVVDKLPMVESKFPEGVLSIERHSSRPISDDEKIKSLRILYESRVQNNIGKIKLFLSDSSDETRLYAFSLISAFEKHLNDEVKNFHTKIKRAKTQEELENYHFLLAQTYWQFIFHGVASEQLTRFYTTKIEQTLQSISHMSSAFMLLGKIHLFNEEYVKAEEAFLRAVELGVPKKAIYTYLAEIRYGQKAYNEISKYMQEDFVIDLRMRPLYRMWRAS